MSGRINDRHGGYRDLPARTMKEWMTPRRGSNRPFRGVTLKKRNRVKAKATYEAYGYLLGKRYYLGTADTSRKAAKFVEAFIRKHRKVKEDGRH